MLHKPRLFPRNVNYITSWLSIVGPVVGLNLPLSYAKATLQDEWFVDEQGNEQSLGACFLVRKMMVSLLPLATPRVWGQFALSLLGWVLAGSSAFQLFERCLPCYKGTHTTAGVASFYVMANILEIRLYCPPLFSLLLSYSFLFPKKLRHGEYQEYTWEASVVMEMGLRYLLSPRFDADFFPWEENICRPVWDNVCVEGTHHRFRSL